MRTVKVIVLGASCVGKTSEKPSAIHFVIAVEYGRTLTYDSIFQDVLRRVTELLLAQIS